MVKNVCDGKEGLRRKEGIEEAECWKQSLIDIAPERIDGVLGGDGDGLAGVGGGSHLECRPISPPSLQPCQRPPRCASFFPPWITRADLPSSWPREATLWSHRFDNPVHISKQSLYVMFKCWVLWVPSRETRPSWNRIILSALAHELRNWVLIRPLRFKMAVRVTYCPWAGHWTHAILATEV